MGPAAEATYETASTRVLPAEVGAARWALPLYLVWAGLAEAAFAFVDVTLGVALDAVLIGALLMHYVVAIGRLPADGLGPTPAERTLEVLPVLALVPLLRMLSVSVPVDGTGVLTWNAMVGVPLLLAAALTLRALRLDGPAVGLDLASWQGQFQIALAGVPLGLSAYVILRPDEIAAVGSPSWVAGVPVLLIFSGLALELVFRGLVQRGLTEVLGRGGIFAASALFAASYLGTESAGYVVFMGLVGAVFGWSYHRTGSIVGVSLAHGLLNVGLLLVWPAVLG